MCNCAWTTLLSSPFNACAPLLRHSHGRLLAIWLWISLSSQSLRVGHNDWHDVELSQHLQPHREVGHVKTRPSLQPKKIVIERWICFASSRPLIIISDSCTFSPWLSQLTSITLIQELRIPSTKVTEEVWCTNTRTAWRSLYLAGKAHLHGSYYLVPCDIVDNVIDAISA